MKILSVLLALALVASAGLVSQTMAQTPPPAPAAGEKAPAAAAERSVTGEIQSIDPSGKELTLKDGTKLMLKNKDEALKAGVTVVAKYTVENGKNMVTSLEVQAPAASPPTSPSPPAAGAPPAGEKEKKQ